MSETPTRTKRALRCNLKDEERLELGQRLAREQQNLAQTEDRKAEVASTIKAEIEAHRATINALSRTLNNGYDYRDVDCDIILNFESNAVMLVRVDTGEVVESRAMSAEERQRELDLKGT